MTLEFSNSIRLKPHFSTHVSGDACVYLFSESDTIVLRGRVFTRIIPLISSKPMVVEDIIRITADDVSPEYSLFAIEALINKALVIINGASAEMAEDACWWQLGADPAIAADRLNRRTVNVRGFGLPETLTDSMGGILKTLGFNVSQDDSSALTILLVNDYLNTELSSVINQLSAANASWVVIKPVGSDVWIGPSSGSGEVCWQCVRTRLLENRLGQHVLPDDVSESAIPPLTLIPAQRDCALNLIASYVARRIGLGNEVDIGGTIHVLDPGKLEIVAHHILADPACSCAHNHISDRGTLLLDYENSFTRYENGYRLASATETYARIGKLVSPISGLIPELCRSDQYESSYIYYARHGFSISQELSGNRIAGRPSWACGKGSTDIEARVSCVAEAVERYSSGYFGNEATIRARIDELENAIHPEKILLFSEEQYASRERSGGSYNDFNWIPERFDPSLPVEWRECISLDDSANIYIPARICYLNYPDSDGNIFCRADSNGCATGNSVEEALLFGLFELIERDAVSIWWFNELSAQRVDIASFGDHSIDRIVASLKRENRELIVLDITSDIGIWTFAGVSWDASGRDRIILGYGTHLDPAIAVRRALNEVMQVASYLRENDVSRNQVMNHWLVNNTIDNLPFLAGDPEMLKDSGSYVRLVTGNLVTDIKKCVDCLGSRGLKAYFIDMTRNRSLLPTVKVIVPGLRHFWPRFAPGRLYDVPVEMAKLDRPKRESELNSVFYPL